MQRDDSIYLRHILDAIHLIQEYLQGVDKEIFESTHLIQDGVIRQLEIIGEAVKSLSPDLRDSYPQVPWQDIDRMRDELIHQYFGVDIAKVWITTQEDIPELSVHIDMILQQYLSTSGSG
jgi:uncharacterized protein with HEPN domain